MLWNECTAMATRTIEDGRFPLYGSESTELCVMFLCNVPVIRLCTLLNSLLHFTAFPLLSIADLCNKFFLETLLSISLLISLLSVVLVQLLDRATDGYK